MQGKLYQPGFPRLAVIDKGMRRLKPFLLHCQDRAELGGYIRNHRELSAEISLRVRVEDCRAGEGRERISWILDGFGTEISGCDRHRGAPHGIPLNGLYLARHKPEFSHQLQGVRLISLSLHTLGHPGYGHEKYRQ